MLGSVRPIHYTYNRHLYTSRQEKDTRQVRLFIAMGKLSVRKSNIAKINEASGTADTRKLGDFNNGDLFGV